MTQRQLERPSCPSGSHANVLVSGGRRARTTILHFPSPPQATTHFFLAFLQEREGGKKKGYRKRMRKRSTSIRRRNPSSPGGPTRKAARELRQAGRRKRRRTHKGTKTANRATTDPETSPRERGPRTTSRERGGCFLFSSSFASSSACSERDSAALPQFTSRRHLGTGAVAASGIARTLRGLAKDVGQNGDGAAASAAATAQASSQGRRRVVSQAGRSAPSPISPSASSSII